tara:strand:+ start:323 stop:478 length:156 start_codon:yes stop_codon:yes gene_type:complete
MLKVRIEKNNHKKLFLCSKMTIKKMIKNATYDGSASKNKIVDPTDANDSIK